MYICLPVMTRNTVDLKDEIVTKIDQKFIDFNITIMAELREQIKQKVWEALKKEIKEREEQLFVLSETCKKLSEASEWAEWTVWIRTI